MLRNTSYQQREHEKHNLHQSLEFKLRVLTKLYSRRLLSTDAVVIETLSAQITEFEEQIKSEQARLDELLLQDEMEYDDLKQRFVATLSIKTDAGTLTIKEVLNKVDMFVSACPNAAICPSILNAESLQDAIHRELATRKSIPPPGGELPYPPGISTHTKTGVSNNTYTHLFILFSAVCSILLVLGVSHEPPTPVIPANYATDSVVHVETNPLAFCSDSSQAWMEQAADSFRNMGQQLPGSIVPYGSRDGKQCILYKENIITHSGKGLSYQTQGRPALYCPDDNYWIGKLNRDWRDPKVLNQPIDIVNLSSARTLLHSRLVLVVPADRAEKFNQMVESQYQGNTWQLLHDIVLNTWKVIDPIYAGQPCHIFMADPVKFHAGLAALVLIVSEYERRHPGVTFKDKGLLQFIQDFANVTDNAQVNTPFAANSAGQNAGMADVVIGYKSDAFMYFKSHDNVNLRVVYPNPTLDVPISAASLYGDWSVSTRQSTDAFIGFLLSKPMQNLAIDYGFRPDLSSATPQTFALSGTNDLGFLIDVPYVFLEPQQHPGYTTLLSQGNLFVSFDTLTFLPAKWAEDIAMKPSTQIPTAKGGK